VRCAHPPLPPPPPAHPPAPQVLVNSLANSKTFQRFAIRSNAALTDIAKKTADGHANIAQQSTEFLATFREEVRRRPGGWRPVALRQCSTDEWQWLDVVLTAALTLSPPADEEGTGRGGAQGQAVTPRRRGATMPAKSWLYHVSSV
jgi:hypothetical protein